jgi:hypothetical protein
MSNPRVERVRYFDGEYLRASDLTAEQAYHIEMRRRLNLDLHLYGVATGLVLEPFEDNAPTAPMFVITPGLGIDQAGREILVSAPYMLRAEDVLRRKGIQTGSNELWIAYSEMPTGLPAAGYQECDRADQNTRIRELFEILLVPIPKPAPKKGVEFVDPDKDRKGIRLGTVTVENSPDGLRISEVANENRTYIGIRAQRVKAAFVRNLDEDGDGKPDDALMFKVAKQNATPGAGPLPGYVDVEPPLFLRDNVLAQQNLVVGDDFEVKDSDVISPPLPDMGDPQTGNLKVARNLILGGQIIAAKDKKWYRMDDYLRTFLPQFKSGTQTLTPKAEPNSPTTDLAVIVIDSGLPSVTSHQLFVSLTGVKWVNKTDYNKWFAGISASDPIQISVSGQLIRQTATPSKFDLNLSWTIGPTFMPPSPQSPMIQVSEIYVNYLAIFYP